MTLTTKVICMLMEKSILLDMQNCKQSGMQKSIAHSIATTFLIKIFNKKKDDDTLSSSFVMQFSQRIFLDIFSKINHVSRIFARFCHQ